MPSPWFLLILVGLILRSTSWFAGAHTTGDILMWAGVVLLIVLVLSLRAQRRQAAKLEEFAVSIEELPDVLQRLAAQRAAERQEQ